MVNPFRQRKNNNLQSFKITLLLLLSLCCFSFESEGQVLESDSLALVDIYHSTGGENWTNSTNWLTEEPVSSWYGVTLTGNRVTRIHFNSNNLQGTISDSLNNLLALEFFSVNNNHITRLPNLDSLRALTFLSVTNNELINLPNLDNLKSLQSLSIDFNQLTNLQSLDSLINLRGLSVNSNELTSLPNLDKLTSLTSLSVGGNPITRLPSLDNLTALEYLNAESSQIDSLPSLNNLAALEFLSVGWNQLTNLPNLNSLVALKYLHLHHNEIANLPSLNNLTDLVYLSVGWNQLTNLPSLDNLLNLRALHVSNNLLSNLPNLNNLITLEDLSIGSNQLTNLPNLNGLINLQNLYIANNQLSFEDLEPLVNHPNFGSLSNFIYHLQNFSPIVSAPLVAYYDSLIILDIPFDGINTQYKWKKNGFLITSDDTSDTLYTFTVSSLFQAGSYSIELTHPSFPDLTFQSPNHNLSINGIDSIGGIFVPNQIIVEYADPVAAAENLHLQYGATVVDSCDCTPLLEVWEFEDLLEEPITFADNTRSHDINEAKKKSQEENDSCLDHVDFNYYTANNRIQQHHNPNVFASTSSKSTAINIDDTPIKVALIDSGVKNSILQNNNYQYSNWQTPADDDCSPNTFGYNFINGNAVADTLDNNLHASHMAAIMLNEAPENSIELMNLKAFGQDGGGLLFDGVCGMHHTLKHDADIVNLSWSYYGLPATVVESALMRLQADSMLIFASAGNGLFEDEINPPLGQNTKRKPFYPGAFDFDNMITVAAANGNQLAEFSNYSDSLVQVAAPGWSISPWDGATALSGSSQATAFATGMAAAYWYSHPEATPSEVKMALKNTATMASIDSLEWGGQLLELSIEITTTAVTCEVGGDGTATAIIQGGILPYSYEWSTGETLTTIEGLNVGSYELTITDNRGIQVIQSFIIEDCPNLCLPNGIIFTNQAEITNFSTNYPDCTTIGGSVFIGLPSGSNITDLSGLSQITAIRGELFIGYNDGLINLEGLNNLINIEGLLSIIDNSMLNSLDGLGNMNTTGISHLLIESSSMLSTCDVPSICAYLENGGTAGISGNAIGCNSPIEVVNACQSVLPLAQLELKAYPIHHNIQLEWRAMEETKLHHYTIERSIDGIQFKKIGEQLAQQENSYTFLDQNTSIGKSYYYRLKMVEQHGADEFSDIVFVESTIKQTENFISVYPNPTKQFLHIDLKKNFSHIQIEVCNMNGQKLSTFHYKNTQEIRLDLSNFYKGLYFIKVLTQDSVRKVKVLKS